MTRRRGGDPQPPAANGEDAITTESPSASPERVPGRLFVGRAGEIEALQASLRAAAGARGQLVTIAGEAGIGKTRTLEEFFARAGVPEARMLRGRCPEAEGVPAYWPWAQALRAHVERSDTASLRAALGPAAAQLARLVPAIRERLPDVPEATVVDPEESRFRLFDGLASFLQRLGTREAHVVIVDDLHWADEGTMLVLEFVVPEIRRSRVLIICTYRDAEMRRTPRRFAQLARADERIVLRGLDLADAAAIVEDEAAAAVPPPLVARLHRTTGGNPYFLHELLRWLRNEGRLTAEDVEGELPDEVRELLRRRVAPLADEDRRLLTIAAALGEQFELAPLAAAAGLPAARVLEGLAAAGSAGLVREAPGRLGRFDFVHALVRETLYRDLPPHLRAELHRDIGRAIEALHRNAPEHAPVTELARHYVQAAPLGEARNAVRYSTAAGDGALARAGYEEAVGHYQRALEVLRLAPPDPALELRLSLAAADAVCRAGDLARAREAFARVAARARVLGDASALARAAIGAAEAQPITGIPDHGLVRLLEEALDALGSEDSPLRARLLSQLAEAIYTVPEAQGRRQALSQEAVAMARRVNDPAALVSALNVRCLMLSGSGSVDERLALATESARIAADRADQHRVLDAGGWVIRTLLELGEITGVDREIERLAAIAEEVRMPLYLWLATVRRGTRALLAGRFAEGARLATEALALVPGGPTSFMGRGYTLQMMIIHGERDRLDESEAPLALLVERIPNVPMFRCYLAALLVDLDRRAEARALFEPLAARDFADLPNDGLGFLSSLASLVRVAVALGDMPRGRLLYDLLAPFGERNIVLPIGVGCLGAAGRYLGTLAAALGLAAEAEQHFERALALETRMGARPLLAWTQFEYARVLRARGDPQDAARAAQLVAEAQEAAEALGMGRLARLIAADEGRAPEASASTGAAPPVATLRREGDAWRVTVPGASFILRDTKGVQYLATLLRYPGEALHVLALSREADEGSRTATPGELREAGLQPTDLGDAGELLDAEARAAYRARLADLRDELAEAERFNDPGRAERVEHEIEMLTQELARAVGLGGRVRRAGSAAERARLNVTRTVGVVLRKIAKEHPTLGEHLAATVRTGMYCSYTPDPRRPVRWEL